MSITRSSSLRNTYWLAYAMKFTNASSNLLLSWLTWTNVRVYFAASGHEANANKTSPSNHLLVPYWLPAIKQSMWLLLVSKLWCFHAVIHNNKVLNGLLTMLYVIWQIHHCCRCWSCHQAFVLSTVRQNLLRPEILLLWWTLLLTFSCLDDHCFTLVCRNNTHVALRIIIIIVLALRTCLILQVFLVVASVILFDDHKLLTCRKNGANV